MKAVVLIYFLIFVFEKAPLIAASPLPPNRQELCSLLESDMLCDRIVAWLDIVQPQISEADAWCFVIHTTHGPAASVTSLGHYVLYCAIYYRSNDKEQSIHYVENQFSYEAYNDNTWMPRGWIVLKNFWRPETNPVIESLPLVNKKRETLSVEGLRVFDASTKSIVIYGIEARESLINISGVWNSVVESEIESAFGSEAVRTIKGLIGIANECESRSLRLQSEMQKEAGMREKRKGKDGNERK